ncbi:MAG: fibronectin type III domain-containing protein [Bacteroidales bacterium]|nr:fibronectin type III domain-containing protein [Bacteroidales bacterium]
MKKLLLFLMLAMFCLPWALRAQQSLPYSYGFENNDLDAAGWTTYFGTSHTGNNGDCGISTGAKKTGDYGFRFSSYYEQGQEAQFLISPELSAASGVLVSFYYASSSSSSSGEKFKVGYSTTDNQVESFTWSQEYSTESTSWSTLEEIFPAGTKYIAIYYYANYQYRLFIDDISLTTPPSCVKPTNLDVTATGLSATFTWASDATQWQVAHATLATAVPDENIVTSSPINTTTYSMEDLALDEDHYFWVRTYCSATEQSEWTGSVSVHIGYCVPAPTSVDGSGITNVTFGTSGSSLAVDDDLSMTSSPYYFDHSTQIGSSYPNGTVDMSIDYATNYSYYTWVWVDWNNDFSFSDDELVYSPTSTISSGTLNISFNVPSTVSLGDYRMRIQGADGSSKKNPCYTSTYSYLVDYTLRVLEAPSCTPAGNVAVAPEHITSNTAVVSWTNNNGSDATYTVKQGETVLTTTATTSYELTGLTASTTYPAGTFTVTSNCDENMVVNVPAFVTACEAITTFPWSENFEDRTAGNFSDICWVNEHISGSGTNIFKVYTSTNGTNSTHQLQLPDQSAGTLTKLRLPQMNLPSAGYQFVLDIYRTTNTYSTNDHLAEGVHVYVSTNGEIEGATELAFVPRHIAGSNSLIPSEQSAGWYTYEIPIGVSGNCYIILCGVNQYVASTYMDNFVVEQISACKKPTALMLETPSSVTAYTATLKWTNGAEGQTAWQIAYSTDADFDPASVTPVDVTTNPATIEGLTQNTTYYAYVRANCGTDGYSAWCTNKAPFTTAIACPAPTALTAGTPGPNSVELNWKKNGAETAWQISIGDESDLIDVTTSNVQTTHTVINGNLTTFINYTLTGLTAGTDYTVKVRANCGNTDGVSEWSNSENFTTAASCPTPVLVASGITNIAGRTADVAWTGFEQNDSYVVNYRTAEYVDGVEEEFAISSMPTGWTQYTGLFNETEGTASLSTGTRWNFGTNNGVFDSHARTNNYSTYNAWLVTPSFTVPTGATLSFDVALTAYSGSNVAVDPEKQADDKFIVMISTNNKDTWTALRKWDNAGSAYVYNNIPNTATGEHIDDIDISAYAGQSVCVAFYAESTSGSGNNGGDNNLHIDNVIIGTPVAAGAWQTENVAAPATSTTLANLDPETTYEVYVTGHCATGDVTTDPSATQTFKTTVACIAPTGLEVTANGVDATFTWESEAGSYEIARATTSNANPNEFVVGTADEESYAMNDLDLGDYYLWVRANCDGEDNSTWSGPVSLHIGYCLPNPSSRDGKGITKVVFGTGENIVNNVDETNGLPSSAPYYGDYSAMVGAVPAGTEATIDITYNTCTSSCFNYGTLIWVDWDNSLTFEDEELVFVGQSSSEQNPSGAHTLNATFTIPVDQALGNYRMRIAGADSYFDSYINGNATAYHSACFSHDYTVCHDYTLQVLEAPSCFAPTDLAVTYEGGTEATVSWTSEATAWNIDVNGTVTAITENPYTLSGLELATNYAVKVQAVCDAATSEWTNPANFSTDLCLPENQCELTFVLTDSYGDGWNGNKIVVTDVATGKVLGELTNENLDGVTQQREENVKTLSVCNGREIQFSWVSGNYSYETSYTVYDLNGNEIFSGSDAMSAPVNYTVNCASCAPVTELEASVNGFDVTLTWEPGGSETDWAIRYREEGTADWNEDINDGSEYEIAGLLPGDYEAEVRALCGSSVTSGWTSTTFTVECPNYSGEETVSICADNYEWNGTNYTTSGDKQKHFTLANGCDSLATLHLTLKQATTSAYETTICSNKFPYTFHGVIFSEAGTQTVTLPGANAVGCDSIMTLTVNMKQTSASSHETTICSNELPYTFHDVLFTEAGTQNKTLTNAVGCDSVVTLTVNVKQTSSFSDEITICDDELPFEFHGVTFQEAGTNNRTLTNAVDCDSVVTLTVNVKYRSYFSDEISVCAADMPYTFHGVQFTVAGTQTKTIPNAAGCDSIMTLTVNVKQPSSFTDTKTVCAEDMPVDWYGHLFTQAGTQTFHSTNAVGCDSTSTLTLYVNTPVHQSYTVDACDSYKWVVGSWSQTYTTPGVKLHSHSDANGCTQVDTLHLTLRHSTTGIDEVTACNSYTWINGTTYTQSTNTPTYTLTNAAGCDSVVTLHLTVNHSRPVSYTITECDSYTWIDGITYNASTTATYSHEDIHGCTQVDTLYLTIYYSATKDLYDTVCEGKPYYLNGFIIPGSDNVEGDHTHTLNLFTINQCDSTVTLHLHVNICDETCGQPITDIDNNSYETMPVHRLCWMTSNLRTTRYSDGTTIPFAIVYSYPYDPNNTDNLMTFGRLYNWTSASKAAAATPLQGVCPDGWRLPTQAEFEELSIFYTETQLRSTDNWIQGAGTNASGFNKQPGGFYNGTTGICERLGASAHFYTADTQANGVIYQISDYSCDSVTYDVTDNPQDGRSIRCVRDLGND